MNDLLALGIDAHGGLDRWNDFRRLRAELSIGGAIWNVKQVPAMLREKTIELDTHSLRLSITPFPGPNHQSLLVPGRIWIERSDGTVVASPEHPKAAYRGHVRETPWDAFHVAYYHLLAARSRGDTAAAIACYDPEAAVVLEPGKVARGADAIRHFTEQTTKLPISFGDREIIEVDGIALHLSRWTLRPPAGAEVSGRTTDVLRRQPDGSWLLLIDNPWGTSLLDPKEAP